MRKTITLDENLIYDVRNVKPFSSVNGIIREYIMKDKRQRPGIALVLSIGGKPNYFENVNFIAFTDDYGWQSFENCVGYIDVLTLFTDEELKYYDEVDELTDFYDKNKISIEKVIQYAKDKNFTHFLKYHNIK